MFKRTISRAKDLELAVEYQIMRHSGVVRQQHTWCEWWHVQVVIIAEADPASIPLEDREDLHVKPDPDAMTNGHTNGLEIKVYCMAYLPLLM